MRFELIILLITGAVVANIYTDGKYLKMAMEKKKYLQMGGVVFGGLLIIFLFKRNPSHAKEIVSASNEYFKYLPLDKNTSDMISPILDFTSKSEFSNNPYYENTILPMSNQQRMEDRLKQSGKKGTKRSVSETKKKYVAASQNWKCCNCRKQLPAWFEVDHVIRLENGGSNQVDNLVALCRDCHGEKTAKENMSKFL
tara:strand:- start:8025 stop:8615 length:591 start_codon:yes stop_codon:yes gene_type:complete